MWYVCLDCGHIFEDGEERRYDDILDVIDGVPYAEPSACCPICGGQYEDASICRKCGGAFAPDKVVGDLYCRECLDEFMTAENMKRYISEDLENFAEWIFDWEV